MADYLALKERPPDHPRRVVRPRKPFQETRQVIALTSNMFVVEAMGEEVFPADQLGNVLAQLPSSLIAVQGFGLHLQRLQRQFGDDSRFNYRVTPIRRYSRAWDDGRKLLPVGMIDTVCNFVGWKGREKGRDNRYHYPLDPLWFLTSCMNELDASEDVHIVKLYRWAREVRDWCAENQLKAKASAGGLAAQLLRDSRFYPEPRRKAPRGLNGVSRSRLPGNYYHLRAEAGSSYRALYLDMADAHHAMARRIKFPDVNTLHGYGDVGWSEQEDKREPRPFTAGDWQGLERPGLFHVRLFVPTIPRERFPPPFAESQGVKNVWLYSNEVDWITRELGCEISCVYSALTSTGFDEGLNRYARFAIDQIRRHPAYKGWLKPTLHSAYGLLAARPLAFETGYYRAKGDTRVLYPMGNVEISAIVHKRSGTIEPGIANVIHRGMIEAEVRKEALRYARFLTEQREKVLAIYADGIFIANRDSADAQLKFLQPPWRVKEEVSNLRFHSATTFSSLQMTRLPGIPVTSRDRFLAQRALVKEVRSARGNSRKMRDTEPSGRAG